MSRHLNTATPTNTLTIYKVTQNKSMQQVPDWSSGIVITHQQS